MQYKWQVLEIEGKIKGLMSPGVVPEEEIGQFQVYTKSPNLLKKGQGTLFIYVHGVHVKYGSDDFIGNSPTSWVEESLFPDVTENIRKNYLLPIGHVARRLNFDHFISYVFPKNLTARGFRVSMQGLMGYLSANEFTSVIVSFSNGAALIGEWLLDSVALSDTQILGEVAKKVSLIICAGGPCQPDDYESKAGFMGKLGVSPVLKPFDPLIGLHPFVKRAGGIADLRSRGKYLFGFDNLGKAKSISEEKWKCAQEVFTAVQARFSIVFLADYGQRLVLSKGPKNWYSIFAPKLDGFVKGFIAKDVNKHWFDFPSADHSEIKQLWTMIALLGMSLRFRELLGFSPVANEIADVWPSRRFEVMS